MLGFNNNVKHRGRVFHIQTEDSGVKRPHVITLLFADGGRIVKSMKSVYVEHVGQADLPQTVRRLMKEQHKAMFIALRGGEYDDLIEGICGPHLTAAPAPVVPKPDAELPKAEARRSQTPPPPSTTGQPSIPPPSTEGRPRRLSNPNLQRVDPEQARALVSQVKELDLDVDAQLDAPPPQEVRHTPALGTPALREVDASRYAPSRPAAIFDSKPDGGSIFGGGISEQSLDDVILSYIADDLEEP
ncbi:MAG: hypothetical protein KIT72_01070 [Polyangiaceae bacterium]|nr:hypothetical protein [Polyangiaceae bacterium]MCW5788986.1 hypothetical protein [Polyangiaceae bacterium]